MTTMTRLAAGLLALCAALGLYALGRAQGEHDGRAQGEHDGRIQGERDGRADAAVIRVPAGEYLAALPTRLVTMRSTAATDPRTAHPSAS